MQEVETLCKILNELGIEYRRFGNQSLRRITIPNKNVNIPEIYMFTKEISYDVYPRTKIIIEFEKLKSCKRITIWTEFFGKISVYFKDFNIKYDNSHIIMDDEDSGIHISLFYRNTEG